MKRCGGDDFWVGGQRIKSEICKSCGLYVSVEDSGASPRAVTADAAIGQD